jgi:hypothetical protein
MGQGRDSLQLLGAYLVAHARSPLVRLPAASSDLPPMSITPVSPGGTQQLVRTACCTPTNRSWKRPSVKAGRYPNSRHARPPARGAISRRFPAPSPTAGQGYLRASVLDRRQHQSGTRAGRRPISSWIAPLDRLAGPVVRLPVSGALASWSVDHDLAGVLQGRLDGSGHGLLAKLLGQLPDLGLRVAAMATECPHAGQSAFLGPAGHGLG